MATFSISLPEQDQEVIDAIAKREHRSRTQQIQLIIEDWLRKQPQIPQEHREWEKQ